MYTYFTNFLLQVIKHFKNKSNSNHEIYEKQGDKRQVSLKQKGKKHVNNKSNMSVLVLNMQIHVCCINF